MRIGRWSLGVPIVASVAYLLSAGLAPAPPPYVLPPPVQAKMRAVVLGGTGATGRELVGELLRSPQWDKVVTIGRRPVQIPPAFGLDQPQLEGSGRLTQVAVDMESLGESPHFAGSDVVFCTLGTTRGAAGSAAAFKRVDLEYVAAAAKAAKAAGVRQFSLLTSQGANADVWATDLKPFHPLLYVQTKGLAEQAVIDQGMERVSIYRPGLLNRGELARPGEKLGLWLGAGIRVRDVAASMVEDAAAKGEGGVHFHEMPELVQRARQRSVGGGAKEGASGGNKA